MNVRVECSCVEFFIFSSISIDLHREAPAVASAFWVELDLRSCCFTEWLSLSQISGLARGVVSVSQFTARKYFADLSFSFVSDNCFRPLTVYKVCQMSEAPFTRAEKWARHPKILARCPQLFGTALLIFDM